MTQKYFMKKIIISIILFVSFIVSDGFGFTLSPQAQISLITCNQGKELYASFGHSAYRVRDVQQSIDVVYNYGTFNFDQPGFYVKFVRGQLDYMIERTPFSYFYDMYVYENRTVKEQVLQLTQNEKQQLFDFLEWNNLPENRFYRYEFFFDNCATRLRDVLVKILKDKVSFDTTIEQQQLTFRDLLESKLQDKPWWFLGINLSLGAKADNNAKWQEYMFLPDYLHDAFANATIKVDGKKQNLALKDEIVYQAVPEKISPVLFCPKFVFWTLFLIIALISWFEIKTKNKILFWFDRILFLIVGLLGLYMILFWSFTEHRSAVQNWNVWWALPMHIYAAILLFRKNKPSWLRLYFLLTAASILLLFLSLYFIPQRFDYALIPIWLIMLGRSFNFYWNFNKYV